MKIVFDLTSLIVGGVLLVTAGIAFLGYVIYAYIREWWYNNNSPFVNALDRKSYNRLKENGK